MTKLADLISDEFVTKEQLNDLIAQYLAEHPLQPVNDNHPAPVPAPAAEHVLIVAMIPAGQSGSIWYEATTE